MYGGRFKITRDFLSICTKKNFSLEADVSPPPSPRALIQRNGFNVNSNDEILRVKYIFQKNYSAPAIQEERAGFNPYGEITIRKRIRRGRRNELKPCHVFCNNRAEITSCKNRNYFLKVY